MDTPVIPPIGAKLGALLLGNNAAAIFYGITSLQTFIYFKHGSGDSSKFKFMIFVLWILDTLHLIFIIDFIYYYSFTNYSNPSALAAPTWSVIAMTYVTCVSDLIVRGIFTHRVWLLSGKKSYYLFMIWTPTLMTTAGGFACASNFLRMTAYSQTHIFLASLYVGQSSGAFADFVIATSLVLSLIKSPTGFRRTDPLVNNLMAYAIYTGLFTTVCRLMSLITFAVWPHELTFVAIYFVMSELSLNALLATLNARGWFRGGSGGIVSIPVGLATRSDPSTAVTSKGGSQGAFEYPKRLEIHVDKQVVMD